MYVTIFVFMIFVGFNGLTHPSYAADTVEQSFSDCPDCPEMVVIPGGEFVMGASVDEEDREFISNEFRNRSAPQHRVKVRSFAAGRYEITRKQYRAFIEASGHRGEGCFVWANGDYRLDLARNWSSPGYSQDDLHPVSCVSWEDATAYTRWLSTKTGNLFRLLTEAEWDYAARGGSTTARFWGEDSIQTCTYGNGADQSTLSRVAQAGDWPSLPCDDGYAYTAPAGSYRVNLYGLYDMIGNVAEWTADCWNGNFHSAPINASAWMTGNCSLRAVRGGAWDEGPASLRSAYRVGSPTGIRVYSRGFRVAYDMN